MDGRCSEVDVVAVDLIPGPWLGPYKAANAFLSALSMAMERLISLRL